MRGPRRTPSSSQTVLYQFCRLSKSLQTVLYPCDCTSPCTWPPASCCVHQRAAAVLGDRCESCDMRHESQADANKVCQWGPVLQGSGQKKSAGEWYAVNRCGTTRRRARRRGERAHGRGSPSATLLLCATAAAATATSQTRRFAPASRCEVWSPDQSGHRQSRTEKDGRKTQLPSRFSGMQWPQLTADAAVDWSDGRHETKPVLLCAALRVLSLIHISEPTRPY